MTALGEQKLFKEFCSLKSNRRKIITDIITVENIPYDTVEINGAVHILLFPENLNSQKHTPILLAHYDRVQDTPGANDNSASVFYLLYHAKRLKKLNHNTVIIFTDKEEISGEDSVTKQGSYGLGFFFKEKNITNISFFVFDMCGIGSTILLGTAGESLIKKHYGQQYDYSKIKSKIDSVKKRAEEILFSLNNGEFFYLNPLFSDDLGLILNEYPAVLISLLPYREAIEFKKNPERLPKSWLFNHTLEDTPSTLDKNCWNILSPLLLVLSGLELPEEKINLKNDYIFKCNYQRLTPCIKVTGKIEYSDYIVRELFSISSIKSNNIDIIEQFHFLSSRFSSSGINYFYTLFPDKPNDITYDLFYHIETLVNNNFSLLPLIIRDKIIKAQIDFNFKSITEFLYNNCLENLENTLYINSKLLKKTGSIKLTVAKKIIEIINADSDIKIGEIGYLKNNEEIILNCGIFNPELLLEFDHPKILKGIRMLLIKWAKANNNNSLKFNLQRSKWIGCHNLYTLVKMELENKNRDKTNFYLVNLWKRYNGKQG